MNHDHLAARPDLTQDIGPTDPPVGGVLPSEETPSDERDSDERAFDAIMNQIAGLTPDARPAELLMLTQCFEAACRGIHFLATRP